ncbi:MAG: hypothetical protein HY005_02660 [Candidatus Staskawiczbacteria bacterium]|nr:hypothetical protein [Candidatus Staskawiczbacteria bacterium]
MIQSIVTIIFLVSSFGIAFILFRKIPILVNLPKNGHHGFKKHEFIVKIEKKINDAYFHLFSKQMLLHKILSKFRVLTLKIERKIDELLHGIRKKAQQIDKEVNGKNKK